MSASMSDKKKKKSNAEIWLPMIHVSLARKTVSEDGFASFLQDEPCAISPDRQSSIPLILLHP